MLSTFSKNKKKVVNNQFQHARLGHVILIGRFRLKKEIEISRNQCRCRNQFEQKREIVMQLLHEDKGYVLTFVP